MKGLGEFELIASIREAMRGPEKLMSKSLPGAVGIGDDCAIVPQRSGINTLVSADMLIEGVHFLLEDVAPEQLGWKAAAVNISDIAAMGGVPKSTFLSIALPPSTDARWMKLFIEGYREISQRFGVALLGGDTTSSKNSLCINVTVLGECPAGSAVRRNGALAGDLICVTGTLGDSAGGLHLILERLRQKGSSLQENDSLQGIGLSLSGTPAGLAAADKLIEKHYRPVPRIAEGIALREAGVHAMMDISDGIGSDLRHILEASGKAAAVDLKSIPVSEELASLFGCGRSGVPDVLDLACSGGEDYELLFTVSPELEAGLSVPHTVIGRILDGPTGNILWQGADVSKDYKGFHHF